jgi:EpsI family protein
VSLPGSDPAEVTINSYIVARGDERSVVLYWYQSHDRIIASEYWAKFWLVADSIRYHRSDTALVRVVVPVRNGQTDAALKSGVEFVRAIFPDLRRTLPA